MIGPPDFGVTTGWNSLTGGSTNVIVDVREAVWPATSVTVATMTCVPSVRVTLGHVDVPALAQPLRVVLTNASLIVTPSSVSTCDASDPSASHQSATIVGNAPIVVPSVGDSPTVGAVASTSTFVEALVVTTLPS